MNVADDCARDRREKLVLENFELVKQVIRRQIRVNERIQGLGYDDLYQAGCMALCHAADTYDGNVPFTAYARVVIKNKLIDHCRQSLRQHHNQAYLDGFGESGYANAGIVPIEQTNYFEHLEYSDVLSLLSSFKPKYSGVALKGIEALELKIKGYSGKEIAEMYGVKPNHVGAWISRASEKLKVNVSFLAALGLTSAKTETKVRYEAK